MATFNIHSSAFYHLNVSILSVLGIYVQPKANVNPASQLIIQMVEKLRSLCPRGPVFYHIFVKVFQPLLLRQYPHKLSVCPAPLERQRWLAAAMAQ